MVGGMPEMSFEPMAMREVTPPSNAINFDTNMDLAQGPPCHPPARDEYEPIFCDNLKQRVFDGQQFYKAQCLVLDDRAYWLQNRVRKAMFGSVYVGHLLQRPMNVAYDETITHWETTGQVVAIKEVSRQMMTQARACGAAEDPRREHAAMQYVYDMVGHQERPAQAMERCGVMMPQDWLQDEHYCYLVMPYCDGGELFDRVGNVGRFSEDEARHWMHQILNCLETLHTAGITHRDLSLENVMIHKDRAVIIDMGMSLNVPFDHNRQRRLITPQGAAGKMKYMAPEVYANHEGGFDGYQIDLWAVGVIMYIMLTGEVPWQMPHHSDLKFAKFTDGWIEPYLKNQGFPISANALCLLQRMLWLNPQDRLCLHQVRAHPWMQMGSFGSPKTGLIRWRSCERTPSSERDDAEKGTKAVKVEPPKSIQRGRYSKDESVTLTIEDITAMQECVQKYKREELRPEEELEVKDESTVLSEDDAYVKKLRAKMEAKAE
jgi:serine/threonine protein kinase